MEGSRQQQSDAPAFKNYEQVCFDAGSCLDVPNRRDSTEADMTVRSGCMNVRNAKRCEKCGQKKRRKSRLD